jgi:hypothetical protein
VKLNVILRRVLQFERGIKMARSVRVPMEFLQKLDRTCEALEELRDAYEDYLIASNPVLLKKLCRSRRDQLAGRTRPFEDLKRELLT